MRDLCMHILDLVQNCVEAASTEVQIIVKEDLTKNLLQIQVIDNGKGIPKKVLVDLTNPFTTSRITRKVGLGTSLLDMICKQSGGKLKITSQLGVGTKVIADFKHDHLDRPPLGDLVDTIKVILVAYYQVVDFRFEYQYGGEKFTFNSQEVKNVLGSDSQLLAHKEVINWIDEYLNSNINIIKGAK